jgi:beta-N-acetylhexosaminidase
MLGAEVRALGFDVACAPVLDVATNPDNPIIGDRAFSSDPQRAADLAVEFADGLLEAGVLPCGKHFPGHGDTSLDSHVTLPRLPHDVARLREVELVPFRAAVERGFPLMMTAHVVYEGVDPRLPATLNRAIVSGLLREELGYDGVVVTDDLEMGAIEQGFPIEEVVQLALEADVDLLLVCQHERKQRRALEAAARLFERGTLTAERLERSVERLQAARVRAAELPRPAAADVAEALAAPEHAAFVAKWQPPGLKGEISS